MKSGVLCRLPVWVLMILLATACHYDEAGDRYFAKADPQIKAAWAKARQLDASNEYLKAAEAYDNLTELNLTQDQARATQLAVDRMFIRLKEAAKAGDPTAKKLFEAIEKNSGD